MQITETELDNNNNNNNNVNVLLLSYNKFKLKDERVKRSLTYSCMYTFVCVNVQFCENHGAV